MDATQFETLVRQHLPVELVEKLVDELGLVERQSKIRFVELVMSLVLTARTSAGGRQADALRHYRETTGQKDIVRGTFYARFNDGLARLMEALLSRALDAVESQPVLLPPSIDTVKDWLIVDSTTIKLHDNLIGKYRGTGDYAALKVHKTYSIGRSNMVNYQLSPARRHDANYCVLTEELRGHGLLVDLGYVSHDYLRACEDFGVKTVIRLKSGWKVNVERVIEGSSVAAAVDGDVFDFATALADKKLKFVDGRLDLDVALTVEGKRFPLRLVGVEVPGKGICLFLTNLDRSQYTAHLVGQLYRLRWEIEKDNKLNKSDEGADELDGEKPASVHTMLYASLIASLLVNSVVHRDHQEYFATPPEKRKKGPMHARLVALALGAVHGSLSEAIATPGSPSSSWQRALNVIEGGSRDPNWRRRPSVLDVLFGFVASPGRPRRQSAGVSLLIDQLNDNTATI
jgi:hypothetical protein